MAKKYKQIIEDLEKAVAEIQSKGISIEPLNKAIDELKSHSENISTIEENIDAVKSEVITPIKTELEQNKKAGKFSIWGFYLGLFGLIVTSISLLYTTFKKPNENFSFQNPAVNFNDNKSDTLKKYNDQDIFEIINSIKYSLNEISYSINGLNENYVPLKDEFLINQFDKAIILQSDSSKISVEAYIPREEKINDKYYPFVELSFFVNDKKLGTKGINEFVSISNEIIPNYYPNENSIKLTENSKFKILNKYSFEIKRIYRKNSQILSVADDKNAVIIKKIE